MQMQTLKDGDRELKSKDATVMKIASQDVPGADRRTGTGDQCGVDHLHR